MESNKWIRILSRTLHLYGLLCNDKRKVTVWAITGRSDFTLPEILIIIAGIALVAGFISANFPQWLVKENGRYFITMGITGE